MSGLKLSTIQLTHPEVCVLHDLICMTVRATDGPEDEIGQFLATRYGNSSAESILRSLNRECADWITGARK